MIMRRFGKPLGNKSDLRRMTDRSGYTNELYETDIEELATHAKSPLDYESVDSVYTVSPCCKIFNNRD